MPSAAARVREPGARLGTFHCLPGLAGVAIRRGQVRRAVHLAGAALAQLETMGGAMLPGVPARYEREMLALGAQLDEAAFAAWAEGQALPLAAAIADALHERQRP